MTQMSDFPHLSLPFSQSAIAQGFSQTTLLTTPSGPILTWERPAPGPRVYLSSGIHGDEPAGPLAIAALMRHHLLPSDFHWILCPCTNPYGCAANSRYNAEGLDLNRDFLKHQSEEIHAHSRWLASMPAPDLFLSLHEDCDTSGFYFYEINQTTDTPQRAAHLLNAVQSVMPIEPEPIIDDHKVRSHGWIFHAPDPDEPTGWPEAIFLAKLGCPLSFTFETPSQADLPARIDAHVTAVLAALEAYRHHHP